MEKALYNAVYNRKKRLLSNGTALVQIEAYLLGRKKYFSTNIYLTPDQWDKKHRKVKNHPNAIKLNKQIRDFIADLESVELDRRNARKPFSLDILSDFIHGRLTNSFVKFMEMEIAQSNASRATKACHLTTLKTLKEFKSDILFADLNYHVLADFETFLYSRGLSVNTINKYFRHVKRYVNLAINKDLFDLNKYPFRKFRAKSETTEREYLTPEELEAIEKLQLPDDKKHLQKVLDMFLFSCYTGLRFSDLSALSKDCLVIEDGKQWIVTRMQKTNQPIRLPLYLLFDGDAIEILNRYIEDDRKYIFDDLTNQYVNRSLKEIAQEAKISKKITFHTARHTTATFLLYKGVNITTVQKLLGHKKVQTTQIYSKVMDMTVINELSNVSFSR